MSLTSAEVRTIIDQAVDRYTAARHDKVAAFIDGNYNLISSLRLHRKALGLDLLRAPANVALALPYMASQLASAGLGAAGADRLANRIRRQKIFFDTDVARELAWRLHTELLELPYDDGRRQSDRDALAAEIRADDRVTAALDTFEAALARSRDDAVFRERLQEKINTYMQSRTAAAELANNVVLAGAGATLFKQLTPGALSLGPMLAGVAAQQAAIASFPLGTAAGSLWYGLFSATPSAALIAGATGGLLGLGAIVTAFAGVLTDPLQRAFGVHHRRLHRLITALGIELKGGKQAFQVRDHYAARIFDLVDLARMAYQVGT
jgi:Family of unknown function (DUF6635)